MIRTRVVRASLSPRRISDGAVVVLSVAGLGDRAPYPSGYLAGLDGIPRFSAALAWGEDGWTGGVVPSTGSLRWFPSLPANYAAWASLYDWKDAPVTVEVGEEGLDGSAPASWALLLQGAVAAMSAGGGAIAWTIADLSAPMDKPLLTARFTGAGGIEGPAEAKERIKRRSWGRCFNVEARILDKANNIWELGDPAFPLQAIPVVRDIGRAAAPAPTILAWQGSIAATFAALQAAAPPQGSGVVAPSIAAFKWWTAPVGPLTADILGEVGTGYTEALGTIAARIWSAAGLTGWAAGEEAIVNAARPDAAGIHVGDDKLTIASAVDRLLLGASVAWVADGAGVKRARPISFAAPVEKLTSLGSTRRQVHQATKTRRVGYQRNERQHDNGEIASPILAAEVTGLGGLATADAVVIGVNVRNESGVGPLIPTPAQLVTSQGQAASIAGQGSGALANNLAELNPAEGTKLGGIAAGATVGAVVGSTAGTGNLSRSDGTTKLLQAEVRTAEGQAQSIAGQGSGALANNLAQLNATEGAKFGTISPGATQGSDLFKDEMLYGSSAELLAFYSTRPSIGTWGTGEVTSIADAASPGGKATRFGNNSGNDSYWPRSNALIPYDPTALYEVLFIVRRISGSGTFYGTVEGIAADRVTRVGASGLSDFTDSGWVAANASVPGAGWTIYRGYISGHAAAGTTALSPDPLNPAKLHSNVAFIRPEFLVNGVFVAGIMDVGLVRLRRLDGIQRLDPATGRAEASFVSSQDGRAFSRIMASGEARDGNAVSFGFTAPGIPKILFLPGGNAASAGQNISIQASALTASGFSMRAKTQAVTPGATITDTGAAFVAGAAPNYVINRTNSGAPWDGRFAFSYSVAVGTVPGDEGQTTYGSVTIGIFVRKGGAWVQIWQEVQNATGTYVASVYPGAVDFGAGDEFGIAVLAAEGNPSGISSFNSVSYTLGSATEASLTPSGASAIPWIAILEA